MTAHTTLFVTVPVDRRLKEYRQDPDKVVTWEEAKGKDPFRSAPEACGVCQNVAGVLFEGDEDAQLAELARPVDQCLRAIRSGVLLHHPRLLRACLKSPGSSRLTVRGVGLTPAVWKLEWGT